MAFIDPRTHGIINEIIDRFRGREGREGRREGGGGRREGRGGRREGRGGQGGPGSIIEVIIPEAKVSIMP